MLMPPQNTQVPAPAPGQFEFMLKDQPKPPGRLASFLAWMPRPAKIILAAVGILFILVIFYSLFFGGKTTNTDQLTSIMARAQEIARVSVLAQQQSTNANTKDLATTAETTLSSQKGQLQTYLLDQKVKVGAKALAARLNKDTDKQLAAALQNNNYDQTYFTYLKTNLASYQNALNTAYKDAGKNAQAILNSAYQSVQTLLTAPALK